jgi:hypothetical protein
MLSQFHPFYHRWARRRGTCLTVLVTLGLTAGDGGCVQTKPLKPELTLQVQPTGKSGVYAASGKTTLPNQSRVTIQAVRQLEPVKASRLTNQKPLYAILDRQQVEVTDGQWQANLNLLKNSPGPALELWQIKANQLGLAVQPRAEVTFLAVSDELNLPLDIKTNKDSNQPLENSVLQFSRNGNAYLQAKQSLSINAPLVKTALNTADASAVVQLKATPLLDKSSPVAKPQSSAPLSPLQYLR